MSLQFYIGPSGSGKTYRLLTDLISDSLLHPDRSYYVIVPEQFSMQTTQDLIRLHPSHGIMNIDVLSLQRLAYRVFDETGLSMRDLMEDSGKTLALKKIALSMRGELPYLKNRLTRSGSVTDLKSVVSEFMQYHVSAEDLRKEAPGYPPLLRAKLKDIAAVYDAYRSFCADSFLNAEEVPLLLAEELRRSEKLRGAVFAFDGFTGFTPVQLPVLRELLALSCDLRISCVLPSDAVITSVYEKEDLFQMSRKMAADLISVAEGLHVPVLPPVRVDGRQNGRLSLNPVLAHLEENLFRPGKTVYTGSPDPIAVTSFARPMDEVSFAAREIRRLIREEGYRFRDIAVITGDPKTYGRYIRRIFPQAGIPCFLDEKSGITHLPPVEFLRALLENAQTPFRPEGIFRLLRTGLTDFTGEEIDRLENYILAMGIRSSKKWHEPWVINSADDPKEAPYVNALRVRFLAAFDPVFTQLSSPASSAEEKTEALYRAMENMRIQEKLIRRKEALEKEGDMTRAREYGRIYALLISLMDKTAQVLGNMKISASDYRQLFESVLTEASLGLIPPGTDQVTAGDVERSRLSGVKVLFFLGVNDGLIPKRKDQGGLLTETDRAYLTENGISLSPAPAEEMFISRFYLYLALTKPSDRLSLSYARTDSGGKALRPSYLISVLTQLFAGLSVSEEPPLRDTIECPSDGLRFLTEADLRETASEDGSAADALLSVFRGSPYQDRVKTLFAARHFQDPKDALSQKTALALYGKTLRTSASALECFAACPFEHFARYGLRLTERKEYSYSVLDRGTVVHEALERYAKKLKAEGRAWDSLSEEEQGVLSDACLKEVTDTYSHALMQDRASYRYEITRLARLLRRNVWAITEQLSRGSFVPTEFEAPFREEDGLTGPPLLLPNGSSLILRGKIDRIDTCVDGDVLYLKIIDYKTGSTKFDLTRAFWGLQLQLPLYMNAALRTAGNSTGLSAVPAGMFYYRIDDPVLKAKDAAKDDAMLSALKVDGFAAGEDRILELLDRDFPAVSKSSVIPASRNKDGSFSKGSKTLDAPSFRRLLEKSSSKVAEIGTRITDGDAEASPYSLGQAGACSYCPYKTVCGFDMRIRGFSVRYLKPVAKEDIL